MEMGLKHYLARYFTNLITIITVLGAAFIGWNFYEDRQKDKNDRKALEERYSKLTDTKEDYVQLNKQMAQLATLYKDQVDLEKQVAMEWKTLALERGERVKLQSNTVAAIDSNSEVQNASDYSNKEYSVNELKIEGPDSPPIGLILIKKDGEIFKKNYKFEVHVESVELKDDLTGKIRIVSKAYLVPQENGLADKERPDFKKWKNERFALNVTGGEVTVDPQEPILPKDRSKGFIPWTMNMNGGFGLFGGNAKSLDTKAVVDTNLFGYGYSKRDLDWKILQLGANYSKDGGLGFQIEPFSYRPLPSIFTNTYLGPLYYITPKDQGYGLSLELGF